LTKKINKKVKTFIIGMILLGLNAEDPAEEDPELPLGNETVIGSVTQE
jgi:hypothetical protein